MQNEQIPERLLRLTALRFLDSRYPTEVEYEELEKAMKVTNCSSTELVRVLAYLKEKKFIKGLNIDTMGWSSLLPFADVSGTVKITAEGIDYLENLEKNKGSQVEEKEKEIGFQPLPEQQKRMRGKKWPKMM